MGAIDAMRLNLTARDATGQRRFCVKELPGDTTVQELLQRLVPSMGLPAEDSTGAPQAFHAFLERDGRHLQSSETVGEALRENDEIVLHPDVQAGSAVRPPR
ncbi:MAG: MoaD/ThiS family protein [Burkholderiales bacterium]|nr:MoaD/ThiS family protein [Burkholderiales bacterium]